MLSWKLVGVIIRIKSINIHAENSKSNAAHEHFHSMHMIYRGPDIQFQWMWNCECVWWMHCNAQVDHKFYNLNFILFKIVRQHQILIHFRFWLLNKLKSHTMPNEWVQSMHWQCTHVNEFNQQDVTCKYFLSMNINLLIGMNVVCCLLSVEFVDGLKIWSSGLWMVFHCINNLSPLSTVGRSYPSS